MFRRTGDRLIFLVEDRRDEGVETVVVPFHGFENGEVGGGSVGFEGVMGVLRFVLHKVETDGASFLIRDAGGGVLTEIDAQVGKAAEGGGDGGSEIVGGGLLGGKFALDSQCLFVVVDRFFRGADGGLDASDAEKGGREIFSKRGIARLLLDEVLIIPQSGVQEFTAKGLETGNLQKTALANLGEICVHGVERLPAEFTFGFGLAALILGIPDATQNGGGDGSGERCEEDGGGRMAARPFQGANKGSDWARGNRAAFEEIAEVLGEIGGTGVAFGRLLFEAFQANCLEVATDAGPVVCGGNHLVAQNAEDDVCRARARERRTAREHFVKNGTECVNVGRGAGVVVAASLLWRKIAGCAECCTEGCVAFFLKTFGESEVGNFRDAVGADEDIGGFEIAMDDALGVCAVHGGGEQRNGACGVPLWLWLSDKFFGQCAAGEIFQSEKGAAVVRADLVDFDDVFMIEPGDGFGFNLKANERFLGGVRAGEDHLDGNFPTEVELPGFVNDTHAAAPQFTQDVEAGDTDAKTCRGRRGIFPDGARSVSRECGAGRFGRIGLWRVSWVAHRLEK